jgi:hypothetical protein
MEMNLTKAKNGVYLNDTGEVYRLLSVDREYIKKKAPKYYLQAIKAGKAQYISGIFQTKKENIYSFDLKDEIGVKIYYQMIVTDQGKKIQIKKGKA